MLEISIYAQPSLAAVSFCERFDNVNIILNNPNSSSSFGLLPSLDVYLNLSVLSLFVCIFI